MRSWLAILGGLVVWAAHFLAIYIIASTFPGHALAGALVLGASLIAIAADAYILIAAARLRPADPFDQWILNLGRFGTALSLVAVTWQSAPVLFA